MADNEEKLCRLGDDPIRVDTLEEHPNFLSLRKKNARPFQSTAGANILTRMKCFLTRMIRLSRCLL